LIKALYDAKVKDLVVVSNEGGTPHRHLSCQRMRTMQKNYLLLLSFVNFQYIGRTSQCQNLILAGSIFPMLYRQCRLHKTPPDRHQVGSNEVDIVCNFFRS
jgi:acyl CoA:acetate/3-ketoacid CoA transferase alpha subunit